MALLKTMVHSLRTEAAGREGPGPDAGLVQGCETAPDAAVQPAVAPTVRIEFLPVADAMGRITDLVCVKASPAVAGLLGVPSMELVGLRLRRLLANHPDRGTLLPAYLGVATTGRSCRCRTPGLCNGESKFLQHDIKRTGSRVVVGRVTVDRN